MKKFVIQIRTHRRKQNHDKKQMENSELKLMFEGWRGGIAGNMFPLKPQD